MTEEAAAAPADLAVVVVNYNAGEYLSRCLVSVLGAAGEASLEVVVVDNASTDGSTEAAAAAHPEVRIIVNPDNRGLSAALNQGILATRAPWVLLLNPDAEVATGTLDRIVALGAERAGVGAIGPMIRNADGSVYPSGRTFPSIGQAVGHAFLEPVRPDNRFTRAYTMAGWDRSTERAVDWVSMAAMFVRRAALEDVGLLDEGFFLYGEELDLCTRLHDGGWTVLFTPVLEVLHEGGVSTGRSRKMHLMHSMSVYRYFAKHRAGGWRRALKPFAWVALRARGELVALKGRRSR